MPRKIDKRTSAEKHVESKEGITTAMSKAEIIALLRSGHFASPTELAAYMGQGHAPTGGSQLGRPENVDTIYFRGSHLQGGKSPERELHKLKYPGTSGHE